MKLFFVAVLSLSFIFTQANYQDPVPFNNEVITGQLSNGLTYFILENHKPAGRAELRLAVNAGSVDEEDDQQGVAHFVEHMCFNGTKKYPKNTLVDYLESIGIAFGPDLNAYTAFDRTVYMLQIPTDDMEQFASGLEIMSEWGGFVTLDGSEIDKERGVVKEEWRLGRGARARIFDKQFPVLFGDSKYAKRMPIGKMDIIDNMPYDRVRDFYHKWYRPDLMAIIAVGDFDAQRTEALIKSYFDRISAPVNPEAPGNYTVPDHEQTRVIVTTDPEQQRSSCTITYKHDIIDQSTVGGYREVLLNNLYNDMLSQRFKEMIRQENPPFVQAYAYLANYVQTKSFATLYATTESGGILRGIEALLTEIKRVREYGFTQGELDRAVARLSARYEKAYNDRDKTESRRLVNELIDYFLENIPAPGISWEYNLIEKLLPAVKLEEINQLTENLYPDKSIVIQVAMPESDNEAPPTNEEILSLYDKVAGMNLSSYLDDTSDKPLISSMPVPGRIVRSWYYTKLDMHEWKLSNGATVIAKHTDFKNDEILFRSFAPGGNSTTPESMYSSGELATSIIREAGVGGFSSIQLEKMLTGKLVDVSPYIDRYRHGMNGSSTPKDLETAFQLLYETWTEPNYDETSFTNLIERYKVMVENRDKNPQSMFYDLVNQTNYSGHYTVEPWTVERLSTVNLEAALEIYRKLFANPGNFTFIFTGNFDEAQLKRLVQIYIGGLPALNDETLAAVDYKYYFPALPKRKQVYLGSEDKSTTRITFHRAVPKDFTEVFKIKAATDILDVRLRNILREDMGATYGVWVGADNMQPASDFGQTFIAFSSSAENVDKMIKVVFSEISKLKKEPPTQDELHNVMEKYRKRREINLETNKYWVNALQACYEFGVDPSDILHRGERINSLTPAGLQDVFKTYFPLLRHTTITLYPAK